MMHKITRGQIDALTLTPDAPLVVVDADEVLVYFARAFRDWLAARDHVFALKEHSYDGAITDPSGQILGPQAATDLAYDFVRSETRHQSAIPGAADALSRISTRANVVVLTNAPFFAMDDRIANLRDNGMPYPVVFNQGHKGPALQHISAARQGPVTFVDDSPDQIGSAAGAVRHARLFHFVGCETVAAVVDPHPHAHHAPESWIDMEGLILDGWT